MFTDSSAIYYQGEGKKEVIMSCRIQKFIRKETNKAV